MSCTHRYQPLRRLPLARRYTLRQPLVGWRRCAKNTHDPKGLIDTRLASPRAPASIAAVGLQGNLSEASSASSQKRRTSKRPNNSAPRVTKLSAMCVTAKAFFERFYLVLGLNPFEPRVNCPYALTPPLLIRPLFLDFCAQHTIWPSPGTIILACLGVAHVGSKKTNPALNRTAYVNAQIPFA